MAEIKLDTQKIENCGNGIIELSKELSEVIDCLFERVCNMPSTTGEWSGNAAFEYVRIANLDKVQYVVLKDELMNEGQFLVSQANIIEQEINSLNR